MKHPRTAIILTILFSITLFILGVLVFGTFFEIILPKIDGGSYQEKKLEGRFRTSLLFSLVLGLTPFLIFLTWRYSPIISRSKKNISVLILVTCMALAIIVRQRMLISYFTELTKKSPVDNIKVFYPLDQM